MKCVKPEDPMELVGVSLPPRDTERMAECVIEEYLLLGWNERQLMSLFCRPFFRATHQLYLEKGEDWVRALIQKVRRRWSDGSLRGGASDA